MNCAKPDKMSRLLHLIWVLPLNVSSLKRVNTKTWNVNKDEIQNNINNNNINFDSVVKFSTFLPEK